MTQIEDQKVALVTGAARSIGAAIARDLGAARVAVAVHYRSRPDEAEAVVQEIVEAGGTAKAFAADLTEGEATARLLDGVIEQFGGLDILVANAGVPNPGVDVEHGTDEQFERLLSVNARAVYTLLREAAPRLRCGGRIINIGSSSTFFPTPDRALYSASKAASLVLVRAFAQALAPRQITVNSVISGPIDDGFLRGRPQEQLAPLANASPFGRLGTAEEIASVVSFLAGDSARWLTGQELLANGGALA